MNKDNKSEKKGKKVEKIIQKYFFSKNLIRFQRWASIANYIFILANHNDIQTIITSIPNLTFYIFFQSVTPQNRQTNFTR